LDVKIRRSADIGATLAMGALAAALAALPDVRRVAAGGTSPGLVWIGLSGSTALMLGPLLGLMRAARGSAPSFRAALVGIALSAAPVMLLGEMLKLHTHHRPLGAATFGFLSLGLVLVCVLVAVRLLGWTAREGGTSRRVAERAVRALAATSLFIAFMRAASSEAYGHDILDAIRVLVVVMLASRLLDAPRVMALARRAGVAAWVLLVLLGLFAARGDVKTKIRERAPLMGGPAAWL
jgi:hypothetical protein